MKFLMFALLLALMHGSIYTGQKLYAYYKRLSDQGFFILIKRMLKG